MIETAEAVANLDEIVSTPGLDGVYIGPADLTLGLYGRRYPTGFDRQEPEMIAVIRRILDAAHGAGIKAGLHCGTPDYARPGDRLGIRSRHLVRTTCGCSPARRGRACPGSASCWARPAAPAPQAKPGY